MIRIFNLYVPTRLLVLLAGEIAVIYASFRLAILIRFWGEGDLVAYDEHVLWKILAIALLALICSHYLELYYLRQMTNPS